MSQHQIRLLADRFDALDLNSEIISRNRLVPIEAIGGFLVLSTRHAHEFCRMLFERGVHVDYRGDALRLGPAPYLSDSQLIQSIEILHDVIKSFGLRSIH